ncbi:hypothetical protein C8T65DRAFT_662867, partial [Cerioporus squamosus]
MPRLGTDSSSSRRHNPQASNHIHTSPQAWHTRIDASKRGESSSSSLTEPSDAVDDRFNRSRASSSRTRWNARTSGNPYGSRPLSKHLPTEPEVLEEVALLVDAVQERGLDDEHEGNHRERAASSDDGVEGDESDEADTRQDALELGPGAVDPTDRASPHPRSPLSEADAKEREKRKKKKRKARAKGNATTAPDAVALPPQDLLVSMSRIAKLIDSLSTGASENDPTALLRWVQEAFKSDGRSLSPERWRADVLQSMRRVEEMLGEMEKWQHQVAPAEIEALRQETARLELRVRAVVEQQEKERSTGGAPTAKGKERERIGVEHTLAGSEASLQEGTVLQADSDSCPSDSDTGPTEPDPEDRSSLEVKIVQVESTPSPSSPSSTPSIPTPVIEPTHAPPSPDSEIRAPSSDSPPRTEGNATPSLASRNLSVPPEPPEDPVEYLTKHPWSMLEVLLLLEVVAHFPAAEHGWTFVAEAYNNLLITRPLQEWFSKQAAISNEEEVKMKTLLQKMNAEARQLRTRLTASASAKAPAATPGPKAKAGERGTTATFGSAKAHAEATARAKAATTTSEATTSASSEPPVTSVAAKDAQTVNRLPFPLDNRSPASAPPPAQCIVPFPRRRPPFTLPSADAREFTRIMQSAAAGVRPPSTDSRAAMLTLYSSTKSRFPVRTSWDCWHRWCTPWIVQAEPTEKSDQSPAVVVVDYIAGNLGAPCGTSWIMRTRTFEYHPVPGTYPDAPGVQHRVSERYDPRPGMVSFARMTHITAEKYWTDSGLGRGEGGRVTEETLASRRSRLPATLAGIWPGKAPPPPKRPAGARQPQPAASSSPTAPPSSAKIATSTRGTHGAVKSDVPVASGARVSASGSPAVPASKPANAPRPASGPAVTAPAPTPAPPQSRKAATGTTTRPQPPFVPLPQPRKQPAPDPPRVPEGTLGSTARPGIRPWFDHAAVRLHALERLTCLRARAAVFDDAFPKPAESSAGSGVVRRESRKEEEEEERGVWVPHHLKNLVIPPPTRAVATDTLAPQSAIKAN